jgi:O-acetylserine/cysteine efflux transporter
MLAIPFKDICLAIGIALCWAFNLVVIKLAIKGISPLTFGCLRFVFVAFPLIFFIKRPNIPLKKLILIGLVLGVSKFALMFKGLEMGISVGMCALTLQTQVIFTALFSYIFFRHRLSKREIFGIALALCGVGMLGVQSENVSTLTGFVLVLSSALCWGLSNNIASTLKGVNMLQLTVWMSLVPPIPYFLLSHFWEGPEVFMQSLYAFSTKEFAATAYIVIIATLFGLTGWTWLMRQHNPAKISIYGLLIPVFSVFFGWLCLDENLSTLSFLACMVVFSGLVINQWPRKIMSAVPLETQQKQAA